MNSGHKTVVGLLVTVGVLIGLVVVADRGAAQAAESRLSDQVATRAAENDITMRGEPEVTVEGFPFLTQVLAGEYRAIRIRMEQVGLDGVTLDALDIRATGVRADLREVTSGTGDVRADGVTGQATVPFSAVEEVIGLQGAQVRPDGDTLVIRMPFKHALGDATVVARADVAVNDNGIAVDVEDVSVEEGKLPAFVRERVVQNLSREVTLPALPYGLKLTGARVTAEGVVASASAKDVSLVA